MARYLKADFLSEFCRQIGAMTGAGITVTKVMEILQDAARERRAAVLYGKLNEKMKYGLPLSNAMEEMNVFPELMINMFRAAEVSGKFEDTANRMAEYYRKEHRLMERVKTAAAYPKFLCVILLVVVMFVFYVIIPMVEPLFREMELPMVTKVLFGTSHFIESKWYLLMIFAASLFIIGVMLKNNDKVSLFRDGVQLYFPITGKHMRIIYTARFARSMGNLYDSGISMVESLEISSRTLGNRYLERQFPEVVRKVKAGELLSCAIKCVNGFDKKLAPVILVGEETGRLDDMLQNIADAYEYEAETAFTRLIALIEPLMIVIVGVVIGIVLLGIMLPMWHMYEYIR